MGHTLRGMPPIWKPEWLAERLSAPDWTVVRLALILGVDEKQVRRWRDGEHVPAVRTIERIYQVFGEEPPDAGEGTTMFDEVVALRSEVAQLRAEFAEHDARVSRLLRDAADAAREAQARDAALAGLMRTADQIVQRLAAAEAHAEARRVALDDPESRALRRAEG